MSCKSFALKNRVPSIHCLPPADEVLDKVSHVQVNHYHFYTCMSYLFSERVEWGTPPSDLGPRGGGGLSSRVPAFAQTGHMTGKVYLSPGGSFYPGGSK